MVGEIACRPRYPHVTSEGYLSTLPASDWHIAPHQEWFRTGDLGRFDSDQNLTYVDRIKDSLRRRGENVSSVEIEAVVVSPPAVLDAAIIGVPSDLGEDDILLIVTLRPGAAMHCVECSISALPACPTSVSRAMSRLSTNFRRTPWDEYVKICCVPGNCIRPLGTGRKMATSSLRSSLSELGYCYVIRFPLFPPESGWRSR